MSERRSAILVTGSEGELKGLLTPKDILFRGVAAGVSMKDGTVEEVMTRSPDMLPSTVPLSYRYELAYSVAYSACLPIVLASP
jgi:CBS domain-containing protein